MKKLINVILCVLILCSIIAEFSTITFAESKNNESVSSESGDCEYIILDDGTAEISSYNGDESEIVIPSAIDGHVVTSIGSFSFEGCTNLIEITIHAYIKNIGNYVFGGCNNLMDVNVATDNLYYSSIDGVLFDKNINIIITYPRAKDMAMYVIPDSVKTIGVSAFEGCSSLSEVIIPDGVTDIGDSAFSESINLSSLIIPDTVKNIGNASFF